MADEKGVIDFEAQKNDIIYWKPRCVDYWSKWRSCVASSNQFHKYYQYGEFEDCKIHQRDMKNCFLWKTRKSMDALDSLISRKQEDEKHKAAKFAQSVWEKRGNPVRDWEQTI